MTAHATRLDFETWARPLSSCKDLAPGGEPPPDDDKAIMFAPDTIAAARAALARQRNPMADPAARPHHISGERFDVEPAQLLAVLREVTRETLAALVAAETETALRRARGRVD
jgi:hypothetical protein